MKQFGKAISIAASAVLIIDGAFNEWAMIKALGRKLRGL